MLDAITVPIESATTRQIVAAILERTTAMAEQIDRLNAAVDRELADDAAQNQLIAELRAQLGQARQAAEAAEAGNTAAQAELRTALDAADAAAQRLESNDPQLEPAPEPAPEPTPEPAPVEPEQPAEPTP